MRNLLSSRSVSFPANIFGKSKTMIFAIITFLTLILNILLNILGEVSVLMILKDVIYYLGFLGLIATLMSLVIYLINIKKSHIHDSITK